MSKGKGPTKGSARFLQEEKKQARQNIHFSTGIVLRQRILPIAVVVAMLVTLVVRTGLCDPKPGNAGISTTTALDPLTAPLAAAGSSSVVLIAQDQASTAPPNDSVPSSQQENPAPSLPSPPGAATSPKSSLKISPERTPQQRSKRGSSATSLAIRRRNGVQQRIRSAGLSEVLRSGSH